MAVMHADESNFDELVLGSPEPVVVDFWAPWCGPCARLNPILEDLSEKFDTVKVVKVDIQENMEIASQFNVSSIPYLVAFRDGKVVDQKVGFRDKASIEEFFEKLAG